jgi:dethiobiotin synthetase
VVVTGTGTDVGKTWVGAELLRLARRQGLSVAARKPVQSFSPHDPSRDAEVLASASGEAVSEVCAERCNFARPMAPPMAAEALGRRVPSLAEMVAGLSSSWPAGGVDLALVEGAGGVASPLAGDGDTAGLARALPAGRVVLVTEPSLGVINAVRLSVGALAPLPVVVYLNRFDPGDDLQTRNAAWLRDRDGLVVTTGAEDLLHTVLADPPVGV